MEYNTRTDSGYKVIELKGEVDLHFSPQARKQILQILKEGSDLMVDLSSVDYIDSSGVASLVEGYQVSKTKSLKFGLIGVSDAAMQVLQLARLDKVFPIHNSIADIKK
ncbi:MAG TPA: anti-sigma factor antagonist [Gammaproteobacteria bacterium]|nr:anti-sigma factor antagonist [Gammaproteobacteria bacterium]